MPTPENASKPLVNQGFRAESPTGQTAGRKKQLTTGMSQAAFARLRNT
jgi:hypothetical protein